MLIDVIINKFYEILEEKYNNILVEDNIDTSYRQYVFMFTNDNCRIFSINKIDYDILDTIKEMIDIMNLGIY